MTHDNYLSHIVKNISPQDKFLETDPLLAEGLALGAEISVIEPYIPAQNIFESAALTFTQQTAAWYFDTLLLNVFPQPIRSKKGFPWKRL